MTDALREFQDAIIANRLVEAAKGKTFQQAQDEMLAALKGKGWDVKTGLKIPYATSPDKKLRLWFKAQAVWYTFDGDPRGGKSHDFKGARSSWVDDIRKMDGDKFLDWAEKFKKTEEKRYEAAVRENTVYASVTDPVVLRVVEAAKKRRSEDDDADWGKDQKKGEWNLMVRKSRATRWDYFLQNPKGGGSGSNSFTSQKAAIAAALNRGVKDKMGKDKVWVVVQEWDADAEEYKTKKSYWMDFPA